MATAWLRRSTIGDTTAKTVALGVLSSLIAAAILGTLGLACDVIGQRVWLEPADDVGPDPIMSTLVDGTSVPSLQGPSSRDLENAPRYFADLQDTIRECDTERLLAGIVRSSATAEAWAEIAGLPNGVDGIGPYLDSLVPVYLAVDVRVTNHGWADGRMVPRQSVLQTGTAVLVDQFERPVVRCICGNPLLPAEGVTLPRFSGTSWDSFEFDRTVDIEASEVPLPGVRVADTSTSRIVWLAKSETGSLVEVSPLQFPEQAPSSPSTTVVTEQSAAPTSDVGDNAGPPSASSSSGTPPSSSGTPPSSSGTPPSSAVAVAREDGAICDVLRAGGMAPGTEKLILLSDGMDPDDDVSESIVGTAGRDEVRLNGSDVFCAGDGNDRVTAFGSAVFHGEAGTDSVEPGKDFVGTAIGGSSDSVRAGDGKGDAVLLWFRLPPGETEGVTAVFSSDGWGQVASPYGMSFAILGFETLVLSEGEDEVDARQLPPSSLDSDGIWINGGDASADTMRGSVGDDQFGVGPEDTIEGGGGLDTCEYRSVGKEPCQ